MNWKLPNQLTIARVFLSGVFFLLMGLYEQGTTIGPWLLNAGFVIYIVAGITDILDGYVARKYGLVSAFGRIVDPVVDKLLVVGALAMLTGSNFVLNPALAPRFEIEYLPAWLSGHMASGVQSWMVVVVLARELIVSAIRGYSESQGVAFPATVVGKIKMFVQSVAICTVLYQMANVTQPTWAVIVKIIVVWVAVIVTVASGLAYLSKAWTLLRGDQADS